MTCVGSLAPIPPLARNGTELIMAEAIATTTTVSRRSTRLWAGDGEALEKTPQSMASDLKYSSSSSDDDKEMASPEKRPAPSSPELHMIPGLDLGVDISGMFPATSEDLGKQISTCLQESNTCKSMLDGKPLNFGAVLPGSVYRSSFPAPENLPFLGTLGLKTILSLVNPEFPPEFREFMASNGIRHCIVEMQGTKRVEIPDIVMNSIMEIALNKENHPLLIHCNHGKHRTGCAVAVIRRVSGWNIDQIVQEYQAFAEPKVRECDVKYITEYKISKLAGFFHEKSRSSVLTSSRMRNLLIASAAATVVWITTAILWGEGYL